MVPRHIHTGVVFTCFSRLGPPPCLPLALSLPLVTSCLTSLLAPSSLPAGAAVKEEQIETKLTAVQADWALINLVFAE